MSSTLSSETLASLERILAGMPDPVRLLGRDHSVLFRNAASRSSFPDGLGHLCAGADSGTDASCPACQVRRVVAGAGARRWHVAVPRPGRPDAMDYFEITLAPVQDGDRIVAVLEWVRDHTASLAVEQYLIGQAERQDEEADRLTRRATALHEKLDELRENQAEVLYRDRLMALGRLVAGVAHEVHTPLGAIVSNVDLIRRNLDRLAADDGTDPARAGKRLSALGSAAGVAAEGARRIERVVRSLRMYSRLDEAEEQWADLREGLDSTLELIGYRLGDRVRVVRDYGDIPPLTCRPDALNQVFMNLLVNAVQAIRDDGEVRVTTRSDGEAIEVTVSDTGRGIPEADLEKIFEAGYTTKGRGSGTGVGLAICRRIVDDHGGTLGVESRPGEGTTFTVRLPRGGPNKEGN